MFGIHFIYHRLCLAHILRNLAYRFLLALKRSYVYDNHHDNQAFQHYSLVASRRENFRGTQSNDRKGAPIRAIRFRIIRDSGHYGKGQAFLIRALHSYGSRLPLWSHP